MCVGVVECGLYASEKLPWRVSSRTGAAEQLAGDMEHPGVVVQSDEVGAERAVVADGRRVVDARVAQQRRVARQLEVDERQVRARLRLVEQPVRAARHVLHLQLRVRTERIRVRRRSGRVHQSRQRLRVARLPLCGATRHTLTERWSPYGVDRRESANFSTFVV